MVSTLLFLSQTENLKKNSRYYRHGIPQCVTCEREEIFAKSKKNVECNFLSWFYYLIKLILVICHISLAFSLKIFDISPGSLYTEHWARRRDTLPAGNMSQNVAYHSGHLMANLPTHTHKIKSLIHNTECKLI